MLPEGIEEFAKSLEPQRAPAAAQPDDPPFKPNEMEGLPEGLEQFASELDGDMPAGIAAFADSIGKDMTPDVSAPRSQLLEQKVGDTLEMSDAWNMWDAQTEFHKREPGWLDIAISYLSMGEQVMARNITAALGSTGVMTEEDALDLLKRDQLSGSDIVNTFWKDPDGNLESIARFGTGILASIIIDPLSYVGIGVLSKAGKTAKVAGEVIMDAAKGGKIAKSERLYYKTLEQLDNVIDKSGDILSVQQQQNTKKLLLEAARDEKMLANKQLTLQDLAKKIQRKGVNEDAVAKIAREGMVDPKYFEQLRNGERAFTIGANIPFTRTGFEWEIPVAGKVFGYTQKGLGSGVGKLLQVTHGDKIINSAFGQYSSAKVRSLFAKTGAVLFDEQINKSIGRFEGMKQDMGEWIGHYQKEIEKVFKGKSRYEYDQFIKDLVDEIEFAPITGKEALEALGRKTPYDDMGKGYSVYTEKTIGKSGLNPTQRADIDRALDFLRNNFASTERIYETARANLYNSLRRAGFDDAEFEKIARLTDDLRRQDKPFYFDDYLNKFNKEMETVVNKRAPFTKIKLNSEYKYLTTRGKKDRERFLRLNKYPEIIKMVDEWKQISDNLLGEYKKRGLPLDQLGIGTPGWPRRYLKHAISEEWFELQKTLQNGGKEIESTLEWLAESVPKAGSADSSVKKRRFRGSITQANKKSMEKYGIKVFVDDPAELMRRRIMEMERTIHNYDVMKAAEHYMVPGRQLTKADPTMVKIDPEHFKKMSLLEPSAKYDAYQSYSLFVPKAFKQKGNFMPYDVYDRMLFQVNGHELNYGTELLMKGVNAWTNVFRNSKLFGLGYLGTNAMGNMTQAIQFNGIGIVGDLAKATAMIAGRVYKQKRGKVSKKILEDTKDLWDEAIEMNVLNSDMTFEMNFHDLAFNRKTMGEDWKDVARKAGKAADVMYGWRLNRWVSRNTDNIFKLGTYIHRRRHGFSKQAAADLAERYFYNYNNVSRAQDVVRQAIPFSTFPLKSIELLGEEIKAGYLGGLTIPGKVMSALEGEFVESQEMSMVRDKMLPGYYKHVMHPIHGELMPGMRAVLTQLPWAATTLDLLFQPDKSFHPLVSTLGIAIGAKNFNELTPEKDRKKAFQSLFVDQAQMILPAWATSYLTRLEVEFAPGSFFTSNYKVKDPTMNQMAEIGETMLNPDPIEDSSVLQIYNSAEFAQAMDKQYGENWLYNIIMGGAPDKKDGWKGIKQSAYRGEFIRKRFRDFTMGLASMTRLDVDFLFRHFALNRTITDKLKKLDHKIVDSGAAYAVRDMSLEDIQKMKKGPWTEEAKEIIALARQQNTLAAYYDFIVRMDKDLEGKDVGPVELLFGLKEHNDLYELPSFEYLNDLYVRPEEIDDADAEAMIEGGGIQRGNQ